ncbi:hypothetical protein ACCO45_006862 [Purpureocillium lilacinum]|uniref:Uncharacterized protein n=1 Tax=Purpureocillium lilacinum TaxID=33203 RepID=A0ACC4DTQ0_PURLI
MAGVCTPPHFNIRRDECHHANAVQSAAPGSSFLHSAPTGASPRGWSRRHSRRSSLTHPPTSLLIVVVVVAVAVAVAAVTMAVAALPYCSHGGALAFTDGDAGEHAAATHPRGVAHQGVPNQAIVMRISPCTEQPAQSRGRAIMPRQANNGDKKDITTKFPLRHPPVVVAAVVAS